MPTKTYRPFTPGQTYLFAQDPRDWLPNDHIVHFVEDVLDHIDYTPFHQAHQDDLRGYPPYDPRVMVRILAYGYVTGVRSSRKLAKACVENVAFRYLAGGHQPKKTAICDFHHRHRDALIDLLTQVVQLAQAAGWVTLDTLAIDGSKVPANANLDQNKTYEDLVAEEAAIEASIEAWFDAVDHADTEDATEGSVPDDRLPPGLEGRKDRLDRIRHAKEQLEQMGRDKAQEQVAKVEAHRARQPHPGRPPKQPDYHPPKGKQRNVSDPESRIMHRRGQHVQGYNAQTAVDASGLAVAGDVVQDENDQHLLGRMLGRVQDAVGENPDAVTVDKGYWNEDMVAQVVEDFEDVEVWVAVPDKRGGDPPPEEEGLWARFRDKAESVKGRAMQRVRRSVVEPVFGDVRHNKGVDGFLRRGLGGVRVEWALALVGVDLVRCSGWCPGRMGVGGGGRQRGMVLVAS